mmetsp:Transcript_67661/g.195904  ORF Transcript_67661/g.195904 Transcript_67661/m.195904 type:complete len:200 (+) Transcript_67661:401-1000(+)
MALQAQLEPTPPALALPAIPEIALLALPSGNVGAARIAPCLRELAQDSLRWPLAVGWLDHLFARRQDAESELLLDETNALPAPEADLVGLPQRADEPKVVQTTFKPCVVPQRPFGREPRATEPVEQVVISRVLRVLQGARDLCEALAFREGLRNTRWGCWQRRQAPRRRPQAAAPCGAEGQARARGVRGRPETHQPGQG